VSGWPEPRWEYYLSRTLAESAISEIERLLAERDD